MTKQYLITTGEYDDYHHLFLASNADSFDIENLRKITHKDTIELYFKETGINYRTGDYGYEYEKEHNGKTYWLTFWIDNEKEYWKWFFKRNGFEITDVDEIHL